MIVAFIICAIGIPVEGFWHDARTLAVAQAEAQSFAALTGPEGAIDRRDEAVTGIQRAFALNCGTERDDDHCAKHATAVDRYLPASPGEKAAGVPPAAYRRCCGRGVAGPPPRGRRAARRHTRS